MSNIRIDYDAAERVISSLQAGLNESRSATNTAYNSLAAGFSDSCGEEAEVLREVQRSENDLMGAVNDMLTQFARSIQFAIDEFKDLDSTGARLMTNS